MVLRKGLYKWWHMIHSFKEHTVYMQNYFYGSVVWLSVVWVKCYVTVNKQKTLNNVFNVS